jgi:Domain of unknown function (DUF5801)
MAIQVDGASVTHDESFGQQNATASAGGLGTDTDDNDVDLSVLALPSAFANRLGALLTATNETEVLIGAALSGYTGAAGNTGSNAFTITPDAGTTITGVKFTDVDGNALNGGPSGLTTADGQDILLYTDSANDNILLGRIGGANGEIVFAAYIEEPAGALTGGKIWMTQYKPITHGDAADPDDSVDLTDMVWVSTTATAEFSLANAPSGQNLFLMFTQANPQTEVDGDGVTRITGVTIIATGKDPVNQSTGANLSTGDTINTSQAGGPTTFGTNSQMIVEQEGVRFTFVTGARQNVTIPNLDQNEADLEANIDFTGMFGARTADFDVVQLQSGKSAQVRISAFSTAVESGVDFIRNDANPNSGYYNDTPVAIGSVRVLDANGAVLETSNASGGDGGQNATINVSINAQGVAFITGVKAGYTIEYTTTDDHNRVLIENGAATTATGNTHADFDIGGFRLTQVATDTAEIGSKMIFDDDAPDTALLTLVPAGEAVVDESDLLAGASAEFDGSDFFSSDAADFGADGDGAVTSEYQFKLGPNDDSGLDDTATGQNILLRLDADGNVEGYLENDGTLAFEFTLNQTTGLITLTQFRAIEHPDPTSNDEPENIDPDRISLVRTDTITDIEGDPFETSAEVDIGEFFSFEDDGPSVTGNSTALLDDDALTNGNPGGTGDDANGSNTISTLGHAFGADGAGTVAYLLTGAPAGFTYVAGPGTSLLIKQGGAGGTTVLTLTLDAATGAYTVTQNAPIVHAAGNSENNQTFTVNYRVTDGDDDTVDGTLAINVDDDTPTTSINPTVLLDDDALSGGNAGGTDDDANAAFASGTLGHSDGADGGTVAYLFTAPPTGFTYVAGAGTSLLIKQGDANGTTVLTLTLDAATGTYTVTQNAPIVHAAGLNENNQTFTVNYRVTDGDGDTADGALAINVDDDTPTTSTNPTVLLDDDALTNGNLGGTGDDTNSANASGPLGKSFGADGGATTAAVQWLTTNPTSGFTYQLSGTSLLVIQGGTTVLTLAVDAAGAYTVTQNAPIVHASGSGENNLTITVGYRVTDKDGDTADGALSIDVDDDTPLLAFGNLVGTGSDLPQIGFWSQSAGADGPNADDLQIALTGFQFSSGGGAGAFSLTEQAPSPDGSGNYNFSGSLTGDFDANAATADQTITFTLTALANGQYEFDLAAPVTSTVSFESADGALGAGGPDPVQTLFIPAPPAVPEETVVFFSAKVTATLADIAAGIILGVGDPSETDLETPALDAFIDPRAMNVSTSGIGVSNNVLEGDALAAIGGTDESIVINPASLVDTVRVFVDNSVSGYKYTPGPGSGGNERLYYTAYYADGTNSGLVLVTTDLNTNAAAPKYFDIDGGAKKIDAVQLTMAKGDVKIPNIEFITEIEGLANDIILDFTASLTDGDGDLVTSNFSVDLFSNEAAAADFDYQLVGTASGGEAFNVDLASARNAYEVTGFNVGAGGDRLVLIGDGDVDAADVEIAYVGDDTIVTITETGGQETTVTVVGVDLVPADIVYGG